MSSDTLVVGPSTNNAGASGGGLLSTLLGFINLKTNTEPEDRATNLVTLKANQTEPNWNNNNKTKHSKDDRDENGRSLVPNDARASLGCLGCRSGFLFMVWKTQIQGDV